MEHRRILDDPGAKTVRCACGWESRGHPEGQFLDSEWIYHWRVNLNAKPSPPEHRRINNVPTPSGEAQAICSCGWVSLSFRLERDRESSFEDHINEMTRPPQKPGPLEAFDAAIKTVTQQRGEVYGHPADDFNRAARLKAVVAECPDPLIRHALEMICVKMARLIHSPLHSDTAIDIAGYARTIAMISDKREKEK